MNAIGSICRPEAGGIHVIEYIYIVFMYYLFKNNLTIENSNLIWNQIDLTV